MTRFAFGLKCGCFGASGFAALATAAAAFDPPSIDSNAIAPTLTPQSRQNHRRLTSCRKSVRIVIGFILNSSSTFHPDLQHRAAHDRPARELSRIRSRATWKLAVAD